MGERMPTNKIHSKHSKEFYGVEASDLHKWLDAPVTILGSGHRKYRHSNSVLDNIPKKFVEKYGYQLCKDIIIDHLSLEKLPEALALSRVGMNGE